MNLLNLGHLWLKIEYLGSSYLGILLQKVGRTGPKDPNFLYTMFTCSCLLHTLSTCVTWTESSVCRFHTDQFTNCSTDASQTSTFIHYQQIRSTIQWYVLKFCWRAVKINFPFFRLCFCLVLLTDDPCGRGSQVRIPPAVEQKTRVTWTD